MYCLLLFVRLFLYGLRTTHPHEKDTTIFPPQQSIRYPAVEAETMSMKKGVRTRFTQIFWVRQSTCSFGLFWLPPIMPVTTRIMTSMFRIGDSDINLHFPLKKREGAISTECHQMPKYREELYGPMIKKNSLTNMPFTNLWKILSSTLLVLVGYSPAWKNLVFCCMLSVFFQSKGANLSSPFTVMRTKSWYTCHRWPQDVPHVPGEHESGACEAGANICKMLMSSLRKLPPSAHVVTLQKSKVICFSNSKFWIKLS